MTTAVLVLDNIRSVENSASIFRTAECLGVAKIYLVGTTPAPVDRFGRPRADFAKVALGSEMLVEWEYAKDMRSVLAELKDQQFVIVSLEQDERSVDIKSFKAPDNFALIVGNEVEGVSKDTLDVSDAIVDIQMKGEKESLNVSVATGIALHELLP
jgi:23S rRNA (guanosine2251-2'-O)-methyltransferase